MSSFSDLSKLITTDDVKSFTSTILVKNSTGYYTDGHALVIAQNLDIKDRGVFDKKLKRKGINFPDINEFIPKGKYFSFNFDNLNKYLGLKNNLNQPLYLGFEDHWGKGEQEFFCSYNNYCGFGVTFFFNQSRIIRFLSLLKKDEMRDVSAVIYPYDKCLCIFAGDYQMVFPSESEYPAAPVEILGNQL